MTPLDPKCPQCRTAMEQGYLLDRGHGNSGSVGRWVQGEPEKSMWTGVKLKDRDVLMIVSFRCARCGLLLDFARDSAKDS